MIDKITEEYIEGLKKIGLTDDESLVYFTLTRHGKKGTYVKDLVYHIPLKRTTIYSILNRLIEKKCVKIAEKSDAPKKAKIFVATSPSVFIDETIRKKKKELKIIEDIRSNLANKLESVYLESMEYSFKDIDEFLQPYFKPLMDKGWKVIEHTIEKSRMNYMFDIYDCALLIPNAKFVKDCGFIIIKFDHIVEKDIDTLNFIINLLKRIGKEQVLNKDIGVKDLKISDSKIEFYDNMYHSFKTEFLWENTKDFQELTKSVILPIGDKIFFLWAETYEFVKEMVYAIFNVERISR